MVPSALGWPTVRKMVSAHQPMIAYPARSIATLWESGMPPSSEALAALLARTRAQLLTALGDPNSTTALAMRLAITPGAVSQHLSVLRSNGLVTRTRIRGSVVYHRTPRGDTLVDLK
ncbi:MAG: winged helix-turn-helix domain-containing protein [Nocardioidaceae bacterium]